jgi:cytochrome c5
MTQTPSGPSGAKALLAVVAVGVGFVIPVLLARDAFQASLADHPAPPAAAQAAAPPSQVAVGGVTLTSVSVQLPDDQPYPKGPGADVMNANCTACHSANMVLNQPRLSADDWKGEVEKMRGTYKATVADKDVPAIVQYLTDMSGRLGAAGAAAPAARSQSSSGLTG